MLRKQRKTVPVRYPSCGALRTFLLLAQAQTALCTAAGENLAAVGGRHSLAETVDLGRMQLLGLISTLRHV